MPNNKSINLKNSISLLLVFMFVSAYGFSFQQNNYSDFRNKNLKQPICAIDSISLLNNINLLQIDSVAAQFLNDYAYFKDLAVMYHRMYQLTNQDSDINQSISYFIKSIQTNPKDYSSIWNLSALLISVKNDCPQGLNYLALLEKKRYRKFITTKDYNNLRNYCLKHSN